MHITLLCLVRGRGVRGVVTAFLGNTDCHGVAFHSLSYVLTCQGVCPPAFLLDVLGLACELAEGQDHFLPRQHWQRSEGLQGR